MFNMGLNKQCFIGLHHYEVYKEIEVKDSTDTTVGINIVSRCNNCGKIKYVKIYTESCYGGE